MKVLPRRHVGMVWRLQVHPLENSSPAEVCGTTKPYRIKLYFIFTTAP